MQMAALHHSSRIPYAYPVVDGGHLRIVLKAAAGDLAAAAVLHGDRYPREADSDEPARMERLGTDGVHDYWGVTIASETRRIRYFIYVVGTSGEHAWLSEFGATPRKPASGWFQHAYLHKADQFKQPDWIRGTVFYQIFPDRFCNGDKQNDPRGAGKWGEKPTRGYMAGGDLAGIEKKLGYLKGLGVGAIYTTPIFLAPTNHKYDTTDYYQIDPSFGTNDQLRSLVAEAHARGIRFLLDAVFNHCGKEWFAFADVLSKGDQSPYRDWFYNLYEFPIDPQVCNYETFANFTHAMPKLDTSHPACGEYLLEVAEHWIREAAIDGWRLDVANEVDHRFWRKFRERVKGVKDQAWILGEIWHDPTNWLLGDQYDSVMNYPWREATLDFLKGRIDAREYDQLLTRMRFSQPLEVRAGLLNLLGSHDTARVRTELGSREKAAQAAVLLLTAEGAPLVYYGDEIGMEGENDPGCRGCYPWGRPAEQDAEMLALYRRLIAIRTAFPWLGDGAWETFAADPLTGLLAYKRLPGALEAPNRDTGEEGLYVVVNGAGRPAEIQVPTDAPLIDLLGGLMQSGKIAGRTLRLPARGVAVLAPKQLAAQVKGKRA